MALGALLYSSGVYRLPYSLVLTIQGNHHRINFNHSTNNNFELQNIKITYEMSDLRLARKYIANSCHLLRYEHDILLASVSPSTVRVWVCGLFISASILSKVDRTANVDSSAGGKKCRSEHSALHSSPKYNKAARTHEVVI